MMVLIAMLAGIAGFAQSLTEPDFINPDRPGIADGSNVVGRGHFQAETGVQQEFHHEDASREHAFFVPTLLRFGINSHWEGRIEGNTFIHTRSLAPTTDRASGFAPVSFGLKYHIQDSNGARHPSLGTIVRVFPASGSGGFHTNHLTTDLRLAADWDFVRKFSLNPNVGVARYEDDQGDTFVTALSAVTLNYLPTKKLNPFVDMGMQAHEQKQGKTSVIVDVGLAYIVGHNLQLDFSTGSAAHGELAPRPFVSGGISLRFAP